MGEIRQCRGEGVDGEVDFAGRHHECRRQPNGRTIRVFRQHAAMDQSLVRLGDLQDGVRKCPTNDVDSFTAFDTATASFVDDARSWRTDEPAIDMTGQPSSRRLRNSRCSDHGSGDLDGLLGVVGAAGQHTHLPKVGC